MLLRLNKYWFVWLVLGTLLACNSSTGKSEKEIKEEDKISDFHSFYEKFHKDSAFQLARIVFPLEGMPGFADSLLIHNGKFYYEKAGWKQMEYIDWDTTQMNRVLESTGMGVVDEYVCTVERFCMTRRFAKLSNGWHLIYYANFNYRPDLKF